jgi:hypothetical protein
MSEAAPPLAHHERFRRAAAAHHRGLPYDDAEMLAEVRHVEDEILLMTTFNGYDAVRSARAQYPQFVEDVLAYLHVKAAAEAERAARTPRK